MNDAAALSEDEFRAFQRAQIHQDRAAARQKIIDRLHDECEETLAARLDACGELLHLTCTNCGHRKTAFKRCDLKWCPACAPRLAHDKATRYDPICAEFTAPLFITITTKNYRTTKTTGIRDLRRAFTKLRRLRWWKRCVRGGVASFELTNKGRGWHPHVHALVDSSWLSVQVPKPAPGATNEQFKRAARAAAEEVAEQITMTIGRSASIKFRRAGLAVAASAALKEVIKYSFKPGALEAFDGPIAPAIRELSLTRNLVSWGTAYRHPTLKKPARVACPCEQCAAEKSFLPDSIVEAIIRRQ